VLETKTALIGNTRYHVTQLPSSQARKLLVRLVKMAGPILASLLEDKDLVGGTAPMVERVSALDSKTLAAMLRDFADRVSESDLEYLCSTLGGCTQVEGSDGKLGPLDLETQELHFRGGRLSELFRWLGFGLEVQYSDFFDGLKGVSQPQKPLEKAT
jgi:hypothetical protein